MTLLRTTLSPQLLTTFLLVALTSCGSLADSERSESAASISAGSEPPVVQVVAFHTAAEAYFSPDGERLILNAKENPDDTEFHVYTVGRDGSDVRLINGKGFDACSFYFPDGERLIFTSTKDNLHLDPGNYSEAADYPTGAELYSCNVDGSDVRRLTHNEYYDAEVSVSPDGKWILFGRQIDGMMDLWRMRPDGSDEFQITHTAEWQEGGAFYLNDSKTILMRAWQRADQGKGATPMTIFTINHDGTRLRQLTHEPGTNWAPYPSPDGRHFVYVKVLQPHNFELFLMNIESGKQTQVTYNDAFDGFPAFAPDGKTIAFSSSRASKEGSRSLAIFLMDISDLLD